MTAGQPVDPDAAVQALRERFPGVQIWHGNFTSKYRAILRGELIEAFTADQLGRQLESGYLPPRRP